MEVIYLQEFRKFDVEFSCLPYPGFLLEPANSIMNISPTFYHPHLASSERVYLYIPLWKLFSKMKPPKSNVE